MSRYLIIITGPTAVGKTSLSLELAQQLDTVIVSCDSRQFYQEMSIGTAKPSTDELAQVQHYFINHRSIHQPYSVGDYEKEAIKLLDELFETKEQVLMVGGSGLFIKAVCEGLDQFPNVDPHIRLQLQQNFEEKGITSLQEQLAILDPIYYQEVDRQNPQRIMRALEVCLSTNKPYSSFRSQAKKKRSFIPIYVVLTRNRDELYARINTRVDWMLEQGLLEEAQKLYPFRYLNALQTVGYTELFDYFDQKISLEEAIRLIKRNTRRYAKRQLTWFRKQEGIHYLVTTNISDMIVSIKSLLRN